MAKKYRNKIAGRWKGARSHQSIVSPYSGKAVGEVALAGAADCEAAIAAAHEALEITRAMPSHARARACAETAAGIERRADELAEMITAEAGKPIQYSRGEVARAVATFTLAAEEAKRMGGEVIPIDLAERTEGYLALTGRFPRGVLSAVTPFNFPLNLVAHKIAPAMATGTPIVLKPSRQAPLTALLLAEIIEETSWPEGALSVLYCEDEVAEQLVTDERIATFSFTGSDRVGWMLRSKAPKAKVVLELGSDAAAIVCADADLEWVVPRCVIGAFAYAGQICISTQRILVEQSVHGAFLDAFLAHVEKLPVGDPSDLKTVVGPVIDEASANRIEEWTAEAIDAGAKRLLGGKREGNVLWPTVLTDLPENTTLGCSEVFGPLAVIEPFEDFSAALTRVNESRYGLQAGLFTKDISRAFEAWRKLDVGGLVVGDFPMLRVDNHPYGGVKDSGTGREGVRPAMEELTEVKTLLIKT
ncbi:MAG: aldehyde dehydrogenase family protein [Chrysiogenetes bacterium]|nr:aldehyde dehydrogenase family protein [Chrysiogenetes bacterium]